MVAPREHTFGGSRPSASEAVGGSYSPLNFTDPSGYTACPNRGGHGCSASSGPGYTALGIGAGAIAVGAAGYGAAQLWAGPQAITAGGATFSPGSAGGGGAAEELAVLGPEDAGGAVPGIGNLASAADAMRFNSQLDARQRTVRMGLKPAGNANVATNGGVPGRAAGADSAVAPVREGSVQERATNGGPAAPCGTAGRPGCRTAAARARNLSATMKAVDELVKQWANSPSPADPTRKETIRDSTMSPNSRHRVELTAGIIVDSEGVPRLTQTFIGDLDSSTVNWDKVRMRDGDIPIGTVHTHPGGPGAEHFSQGDIDFAHDFRQQLRSQGVSPKTGVQIYVVQPSNVGGILNYDEARNLVSPLP